MTPRQATFAAAMLLVACSSPPSTADAGDGGSADAGRGDPNVSVGGFHLRLVPPGSVSLLGKVYDGPSPALVIWEPGQSDGECTLYTPRVPFCSKACGGSAACVEDDTCQRYPVAHSVGQVSLSGVHAVGGATTLDLIAVANSYQPPAGTDLAYPPFAAGEQVTLSAAGGDYAAFTLEAKGIAPLTLSNATVPLDTAQALTLTWPAATDPQASRVHVKLDISHHGGSKGKVECDGPDDGSLTLAAPLVTQLLMLGVAGFPTIIVTRSAVGSAVVAPGRVDLTLSSAVEREVLIAGLVSCNDDGDCPTGQTCQPDLRCQ